MKGLKKRPAEKERRKQRNNILQKKKKPAKNFLFVSALVSIAEATTHACQPKNLKVSLPHLLAAFRYNIRSF